MITSSYPRFVGDGTAPFIKSISETLVRLGDRVYVVAPYDPLVQPEPNQVPKIKRFKYALFNKWHILGHARALEADIELNRWSYLLIPFYIFFAIITMLRFARSYEIDLIYAHWVLPNGFPAAIVSKLLNIPLVISIHGSDAYIANKNKMFQIIAKWTFSQAKSVTACSPTLKEMAILAGAPLDTILLPYGVYSDQFSPNSDEKKSNKLRIAALGRLVYKKGFENLVNAMEIIHRIHPETELLIGGDGPLLNPLKELATKHSLNSIISFLGRIPWDHTRDFLINADIFVLPSIIDSQGNVDGLPNVLLEAMACGCPTVASDISGVPLVVINNYNGILVPPGDQDALASAIIKLIELPKFRRELGDHARKTIEETLDWKVVGERIQNILKNAIALTNQ